MIEKILSRSAALHENPIGGVKKLILYRRKMRRGAGGKHEQKTSESDR